MWKLGMYLAVPVFVLGLTACSDAGPAAPDPASEGTVLRSVVPTGGSVDVGVDTFITVEFSHRMDPAMSGYADVHEGALAGPLVPGIWEWLGNHDVLRFTPSERLESATSYVIHVGGGMVDADGELVDLQLHGDSMGGEWATDGMMGGDAGGSGTGHMASTEHMGDDWDHPFNGSHGMIFTFTTSR